jgi:hypothetical protein
MVIKQVNQEIIDVFCGQGWLNWTRFEKTYLRGSLMLGKIKGRSLTPNEFKSLITILQES